MKKFILMLICLVGLCSCGEEPTSELEEIEQKEEEKEEKPNNDKVYDDDIVWGPLS